tara:strand:+ start:234 stop:851 length:618 start_codon:yes stop_codon:yes gene_type:complete
MKNLNFILILAILFIQTTTTYAISRTWGSISFERGTSLNSVDFTEYDSKFSGDTLLNNQSVSLKYGYRFEQDFIPPMEPKLVYSYTKIDKPGQFYYTCEYGLGGELTIGAGQFINVSFGGIYCGQGASTAIIYNSSSPADNPYPSTLARTYGILGLTFPGRTHEFTIGYHLTNDQLRFSGTENEGPKIIQTQMYMLQYQTQMTLF